MNTDRSVEAEKSAGASSSEKYRLGVLDLVPRLDGASAEEALRQAVMLAQHAEAWGYSRYWTSEHHDMEELASASPEVLLAHVGALTKSIRLGSGAVLLPHYSPLKVAESFRLLSALYPGRVELGLGRAPGGGPHAAMALSGNYLQHVSKLPESLTALTQLLEDRYAYEGHPVLARPIPGKSPSLWMLGTNMKSAEYAARFGMGYAFGQFMSDTDGLEAVRRYRDGFIPSADRTEPEVMVAVSVLCAETEQEALDWSLEMERKRQSRGADPKAVPSADEASPSEGQGPKRHYAGTADQVWTELNGLASRLGTHQLLVVTGGPDYKRRLSSYRLLAECEFAHSCKA